MARALRVARLRAARLRFDDPDRYGPSPCESPSPPSTWRWTTSTRPSRPPLSCAAAPRPSAPGFLPPPPPVAADQGC